MKYFEFGTENPELMVMLHGGGTTYLGMLPTAKVMAKVCHVVLVAYDGFDPDEPETEFVSSMDEARRLGDYIVEHYHRQIREHTCFAEHYMLGIPCSAEIHPYRVKTLGHTTSMPCGPFLVWPHFCSGKTAQHLSANNYTLPPAPAKAGCRLAYWYGEEEKKARRHNIRFITGYFPHAGLCGIPQMDHAELVIIHPQEFYRYAKRFLDSEG